MTNEMKTTYKTNYIDNKTIEFIAKTGHEPAARTLLNWGKLADWKIREMQKQILTRTT